MSRTTYMSTSQVARHLGVSVATVKRWVDDGVLPAHRTAGGHRRILQSDLQRVTSLNHFPTADPNEIAAVDEPSDQRRVVQRLYREFLSGDASSALAVVQQQRGLGNTIAELADAFICPAMARVGQDWESGKIDVYQEHRATRTCESILIELKSELEQSADNTGPIAIGGCPESDPTVISSLLVQLTLLENGWQAINFGPHTPMVSLAKAIKKFRPKLLWITATHPLTEMKSFLRQYQDLYQDAEQQGVAVALGGRALTPELRSQMSYTMFGDGMAQLAAFARTLHARYQRPRRGRPPVKRSAREK